VKIHSHISARKLEEYNLCHKTTHKEKFGRLEGKLTEDKFNVLKSDLQWQHNALTVANKSSEASVYASFALSKITATLC
jgi:hypothetical protein